MIQRWRQANIKLPILTLTAPERWQEKVVALNSSADDYVTKPFHLEEILARIQTLMRRNSGLASQILQLSAFIIDMSREEFTIRDKNIKLMAFEYTILETLMCNNSKVVSKESLIRQFYPDAELRESHTIVG